MRNGKVSKDVGKFGWSWKAIPSPCNPLITPPSPAPDEECKEEPQPDHPCEALGVPDWVLTEADEACDLLDSAPFTSCHGLVDVENAKYSCKYDVCACYDRSCACTDIKEYVKECQESGGQGLGSWRSAASFCPMECKEPFQYESCGSFCPPTCADKSPTCDDVSCNEGCFCPQDSYLQNGTCVSAEECLCQVNGTFVDVGTTWEDYNICKDCACKANGEIQCESMYCRKCNKQELPISKEGSCCNECVENWAWAKDATTEISPELQYQARHRADGRDAVSQAEHVGIGEVVRSLEHSWKR
eukprot:sb/3467346/